MGVAALLTLPLTYSEGLPKLHVLSVSAPTGPPPGRPPAAERRATMNQGQSNIFHGIVLRAIISRTGAIENLQVTSGHPRLVGAALDAVRQWRYRPYILNDEPVEVETQVTVNFSLSGS
jgi:hypothetical protein